MGWTYPGQRPECLSLSPHFFMSLLIELAYTVGRIHVPIAHDLDELMFIYVSRDWTSWCRLSVLSLKKIETIWFTLVQSGCLKISIKSRNFIKSKYSKLCHMKGLGELFLGMTIRTSFVFFYTLDESVNGQFIPPFGWNWDHCNDENQENMRGQKGTLPVYALWYVTVTKVIYRLAHKRKCVFRDVRIKTTLSSIWYG